MKIAIMGAMPEEISPILEKLDSYKTIEFAGNRYYETTYRGVELIIAYSKIGKVFSALTATTMIEHFGADRLLFSGVAGAVSPMLRVGDLIVATKLSQHDLDITAFGHPYGYVPEGAVFVEADREMIEISKAVALEMGKKVQEGIIATGDQFVANEERKNWIGKTFGADALEMEGGSVAVVCNALGVPFFILRAISDAADMDASFSFDEFLQTSAKESAEFVMKMVDKLVD
ncbi:MAG: 5'-methylthioadenosine/adenosylhomocysteine nucleosidase [Sulfurimonas sp.]|jgi:adenosylhomocysteine/aminodeoxyfutalosine nucleosidase|uniref:5'-methylthioadenosine/adenosylhomocysteine nucleosidase n=1 Tax=unclassified Sulfurimonas TaxID=2623549 RepID=UPI0008C7A91D|nr:MULTISPECIES: 5'-methylthioadenosine/adenosylhomocysteine nucleosidase [unclassified Sulfurimonas]MBS4069422.1 5'-methylthioadenosine/adenosylhomocysteine nucleosidase [Sulfurimonas sp.]MDD3855763.1 5'-methylthioadenosine/adenosylhomocysteine nucleosidase [Sulfurimonas sp.]OHE03388.1 MAG: 5'-methylthioadenosine/S-adenosylhomocysteine nucleosidase [Sulfurimonas sp. RIFOXYB12_FULL_35_9]